MVKACRESTLEERKVFRIIKKKSFSDYKEPQEQDKAKRALSGHISSFTHL